MTLDNVKSPLSSLSVRRILLLGATGGTGRRVVEHAAAMDLEVTALVRNPDRLPATPRGLRVVTGEAAGERVIRNSGLDWTIVYPTGLTDGPRTDSVRVGERLHLVGFPPVSRADVAAVLLRQLSDRSVVGKGILVST